jgi:hypothetical protein
MIAYPSISNIVPELSPPFLIAGASVIGTALFMKYGTGEVADAVRFVVNSVVLPIVNFTIGIVTGGITGFILSHFFMENLCDCDFSKGGLGSNMNGNNFPLFWPVAGSSIGAAVLGTVIVKKYKITIPFPAFTIGLVAGGLLIFNLSVFLQNVMTCRCLA